MVQTRPSAQRPAAMVGGPLASRGLTIEARATIVPEPEFDASAVHDALYRSTRRPWRAVLQKLLHGLRAAPRGRAAAPWTRHAA